MSITRGQSDIVVSCEFDESGSGGGGEPRFGFDDGRFCFGVVTYAADPAMSLRACASVPTEFSMVRGRLHSCDIHWESFIG